MALQQREQKHHVPANTLVTEGEREEHEVAQ